jgi:hypothetical protein
VLSLVSGRGRIDAGCAHSSSLVAIDCVWKCSHCWLVDLSLWRRSEAPNCLFCERGWEGKKKLPVVAVVPFHQGYSPRQKRRSAYFLESIHHICITPIISFIILISFWHTFKFGCGFESTLGAFVWRSKKQTASPSDEGEEKTFRCQSFSLLLKTQIINSRQHIYSMDNHIHTIVDSLILIACARYVSVFRVEIVKEPIFHVEIHVRSCSILLCFGWK